MGRTFVTAIVMIALPVVVFLGGGWIMNKWSGRQRVPGKTPLNMKWHYDIADVKERWGALNEAGLRAEKKFLELDLVFPFLYGGALAAGLLLGWAALGRPFHPAWLVAPVAVTLLADWTENLVQIGQLNRWLARGKDALQASSIQIATTATTLKLLFFCGSWLILLSLAGILLVRAFKAS
jgi:hypothetical protein